MKTPAWLDLDMRPAGGNVIAVSARIAWWRPSFWRFVREQVEVKPRWLTWLVVAWVILRWRVSR